MFLCSLVSLGEESCVGYYSEWQFPFQGKTCAIFQSKNPHAPFKMKKLKLTNNSIMSSNSDKSLKNELVMAQKLTGWIGSARFSLVAPHWIRKGGSCKSPWDMWLPGTPLWVARTSWKKKLSRTLPKGLWNNVKTQLMWPCSHWSLAQFRHLWILQCRWALWRA